MDNSTCYSGQKKSINIFLGGHFQESERQNRTIKLGLVVYRCYEFITFKVCKSVHHSVQNLLSSRLLSKNLKIKIYRTIILPVVLCGFETWLLTLREERRLRVFENRVLRRVFGPKMDEVTGEWRSCITRS
jgi:hypothetical protein